MYEVASPDRVRDSLTRLLRVQPRPELSERATSTRLPSLWMHIWVENNFKFWADSRQLPKMLRGKFWHFWWSRFMTLRCWEALDCCLSVSLARPGLAGRPRSLTRPRSAELSPSLVSSLASQSRVSRTRGPVLHRSCELWTVTASENHECSLQVNNNQFWPSSLWSTITSSVPENYTNTGDPLFYYDIKIKWKKIILTWI